MVEIYGWHKRPEKEPIKTWTFFGCPYSIKFIMVLQNAGTSVPIYSALLLLILLLTCHCLVYIFVIWISHISLVGWPNNGLSVGEKYFRKSSRTLLSYRPVKVLYTCINIDHLHIFDFILSCLFSHHRSISGIPNRYRIHYNLYYKLFLWSQHIAHTFPVSVCTYL